MQQYIEITLDIDVIATLALEAHKQDITLNQYILNVLEDFIKEIEDGDRSFIEYVKAQDNVSESED